MSLNNFIYVKECLGKDRKPLRIYKIRTMRPDASNNADEFLENNCDSFGKLINDKRVTSLGKFLRKYWIDELPQLYNFAKGDLKFVGIRPMSETKWNMYPAGIMDRALKQKPGLIGILYAFPYTLNFKDIFYITEEYLDKWEKDPIKTDKEYFNKILKNIFSNGIRSH